MEDKKGLMKREKDTPYKGESLRYLRGIIKIEKESITVEELLDCLREELALICDANTIDEVSLTCFPAFREIKGV